MGFLAMEPGVQLTSGVGLQKCHPCGPLFGSSCWWTSVCQMGLHVQYDDDTSLMSLSQLRRLILLHCHSVVQLQRFTDLPKLLIHQLQSQ